MNKKAFSFVELIIAVVIITLLGIVGFTINHSLKIKTNNGKVGADVLTIKSGVELYKTENSTILAPKGNLNYFTASGTYAHDEEEAYGVYGKFTENSLAKKYLDIVPLDPKTNQYYSYGVKIVDNKNGKGSGEFEIAGVLEENDEYKAKVVGNYDLTGGISSLIREYNGPRFIKDTYGYLPYNPETRLLIARDLQGNVYKEGDEVIASNNDLEIYFSDGSMMLVRAGTNLKLEEMHFKNDNNLFTAIKMYLSAGSVWIQATKLDEESSFDIHTQDFEAAVRGTSFGVTPKDVIVYKGLVEVTPKGSNSLEVSSGQKYSGGQVSNESNIIVPIFNGTADFIVTPINIIDEYTEELISIGDNGKCYLEDLELQHEQTWTAFKEKESLNCEGITKTCVNGEMKVLGGGMSKEEADKYMYKECNTITLPWQDCKKGTSPFTGVGAGYDFNSSEYREGIGDDTWHYVPTLTFGNTCEFTCKISTHKWNLNECVPLEAGICGSASGGSFASKPNTNLCDKGTPTVIDEVNDEFSWKCINDGKESGLCSATKSLNPISGKCGTSNGKTFASQPSTNLCGDGVIPSVSGGTNGPWLWRCPGSNGGADSPTCSASKTPTPINGLCGSVTNSCSAGSLINSSQTTTQYLWSCQGSNGGTTASCSANKVLPPVNGVCGSNVNSCSAGSPSNSSQTTTQYLWSCQGSNGGTTASCKNCKSNFTGANCDIYKYPISSALKNMQGSSTNLSGYGGNDGINMHYCNVILMDYNGTQTYRKNGATSTFSWKNYSYLLIDSSCNISGGY